MTNTYGEYGTLIVCGDYQGDLEAIAKVFNAFEFDQGDDEISALWCTMGVSSQTALASTRKHRFPAPLLVHIRKRKRHDKVGNERLLRDFKLHYFGNEPKERPE